MLNNIKKPKRKPRRGNSHAGEPIKVGSIFTGRVKDLSSDGSAVVDHPSGKVCFSFGVWVGELAEFEVTQSKGRYAMAKLKRLIEPSGSRVDPKCKYHGVGENSCAGCPWMFIDYPAQLEQKQNKIKAYLNDENTKSSYSLDKIIKPISASEKLYHYRNRAQFKTDGRVLGYVARHSKTIVDVESCVVLCEENQTHLTKLRHTLPNQNWKIACEKKQRRASRDWVSINVDDKTPFKEISVDKRLVFRQGNTAQNQVMKSWLSQKLSTLPAQLIVLELFCGSGNFTSVLLQKSIQKLVAVEGSEKAIENLKLSFANRENFVAEVKDLYTQSGLIQALRLLPKANMLLVDPPRAGLDNLPLIFKYLPELEYFFYISCDLATFTRDKKIIESNGFELRELQPIDQFVHTPHVELLAYFNRVK